MQTDLASRTKTILIVEDSLLLNEVAKSKFEKAHFTTIFYSDPQRALEYLMGESTMPDAILVDYRLEGMQLSDFIKEVMSYPRSSKIPVIVIGEGTTQEEKDKVKKMGAVEYLTRNKHRIGDIVHIIVAIIERSSQVAQ